MTSSMNFTFDFFKTAEYSWFRIFCSQLAVMNRKVKHNLTCKA